MSLFLQVAAKDPDCGVNARVTYSMSDDSPNVRIDANGTVCLTKALDYETKPQLQLSILAHDAGQ